MRKIYLFLAVLALTISANAIKVESHQLRSDGVQFKMSEGALKIQVCKDDIFHVVYSPANIISDVKTEMINKYDWQKVKWKYTEDKENGYITTDSYKVQINLQTGAISYFDKSGKLVLSEPVEGGKEMNKAVVCDEDTYHAQQTFQSPNDEAIFGLGQFQEGLMNFKDCFLRLEQFNTVIALPFYLSNRGYGVLWNNSSKTEFNPEKKPIEFKIHASFDKHWALYKAEQSGTHVFIVDGITPSGEIVLLVDDQKVIDVDYDVIAKSLVGRVELKAGQEYEINIRGNIKGLYVKTPQMMGKSTFWSEVADRIDYYFIGGQRPDNIIANMREVTGQAPMFPKWALGFTQSLYTYDSQEKMLGVAKDYRERNIPVDIIVQDMNYWTATPEKNTWGSHLFDKDRYPNPKQMFTDLHDKYNVHTLVSVWPRINKDADLFDHFVKNGYALGVQNTKDKKAEGIDLIGDQDNVALDPYNPDARKAYWKFMKERLWDLGADGWWLDASEPEWGYDFRNSKTFAGSGAKNLNTYSLMQTKGIYEGQRSVTSDKRVVILTRSAFPGQQRYATQCWSGDIGITWQTLKQQIPAGLNFSMGGMPYWSSDIGGFRPFMKTHSPSYRELVVRWFQYGTFVPIFRVHGCRQTELWQLTKKEEDIQVAYDKFHYRLMPYLYSLSAKVTFDGYTILRGLVMDFPSDANVMNIDDQYMFGSAFLVNPITEYKVESRKVYLPQNEKGWFNFWTGKQDAGGQTLKVDAPIDQIPLFIPAGTILPLGPDMQYATEKQAEQIELRVYTGKDASFTLYEDENDNYNYEKGVFANIPIQWDEKTQTLTIGNREGSFPGMLEQRIFNVVFVSENKGTGINHSKIYDKSVVYKGQKTQVKK